jgi:MFS family permease
MTTADIIMFSVLLGAVIAFGVIIYNYAKGLHHSPRDMWLLFAYKVVEYSAYAAMNMTVILWLSKDCGLSDVQAGVWITIWSVVLSVMGMLAGSLVDVLGIRKIQIISVCCLIFSRIMFAFVTDPYLVLILAFFPLGVGFAMVGPLISVAIKRFTTKEGAALGFGLFYVLMNMGYAAGGIFFDWIRGFYATRDAAGKVINENAGTVLLGHHFSTYQMVFVFGLAATGVSLLITFFIRDGVEMQPDGSVVIRPPKPAGPWQAAIKKTAVDTGTLIAKTATHRYFWIFMGMLTITLFVRFVFFHFHYTFPKYGIRVLGEGAKIGSIYGVLNPVLIIFLVPLVASLTKKVSSYKMMIFGATVSSLACFIAVIPASCLAGLTDSVLGELIFVKWLRMAPDMATLMQNPPTPSYWPLIIMIVVFTIGEAIWSPRLMQFTAEIAPKGQEGTYIALAVLPFFVAKFFVGPMSGWLVKTYTPLDESGKALAHYPHHQMIWLWIGGMAVMTPIGLLLFRHWFIKGAELAPPPPPPPASLAEAEVEAGEETEGRS